VEAGTADQYTWLPSDVGVKHFGCLNNNYPPGVFHHYYFSVAAINGNGKGDVSTSPTVVGLKC
jgi:hypothetical protein